MIDYIRRDVLWERDRGICHICGLAADPTFWHVDHKIPIRHGGAHSYANVGVAHPSCNSKKGSKLDFALTSQAPV